MTIRRACDSDLAGVNKLLYEVEDIHRIGRPDIFRVGAKKYTDSELLEIFKDDSRPVFVATEDSGDASGAAGDEGAVLGYAFCEFEVHSGEQAQLDRKTLYLDDLCVDESARGKHVGRALYDFVLEYACANGCYNVTLHAWECNPKALAFYRHLGMKTMYTALETIL